MISEDDKPNGDRDILHLTDHNVKLETMLDTEMENMERELDDGSVDPEVMERTLNRSGEKVASMMWEMWGSFLFKHRFSPIPLFSAKKIEKSGVTCYGVRKDTYGHNDRPVLKRSKRFSQHMRDAGLALCLQYAVSSDKRPHEVVKDVPFQFFPTEIRRIRRFVEENEMIWMENEDTGWWNRSIIGKEMELIGIIYFMYTLDEGEMIPKYVGLSRLNGVDDEEELNWNFQNVTADGVYARWGYGKSQHLGELSCAMWPDEYPWDPERKYRRWKDELFFKERILREPVYIEVVPWLRDDLIFAETNLIQVLSTLYGDELLNQHHSRENATLSDY